MKFLKYIFLSLIVVSSANAVNPGCSAFDDCDTLVACELVYDLEASMRTGQNTIKIPSSEQIVSDAISSKAICKDYASTFKGNIDTEIQAKAPNVRLTIDWSKVKYDSNERSRIEGDPNYKSVVPWYGILVVKKGSLDKYAAAETPVISTEYMKNNRNVFYPDNSSDTIGKGCTYHNHMANDNDVINRAAHITRNEKDSFWTGNDYYVFDGSDVYWGWATIAGEVALAILTFGISAEVSAAAAATKAAASAKNVVTAAQTARKAKLLTESANIANKSRLLADATRVTKDVRLIDEAIKAGAAAQKGTSAAAVASRAKAVQAFEKAGLKFGPGNKTAKELKAIGQALEGSKANLVAISADAATAAAEANRLRAIANARIPLDVSLNSAWRLVQSGTKSATAPARNIFNKGLGWKKRFVGGAATAASLGIGWEIMKAWGYSSSTVDVADNVKFNSFGLLSLDDDEGRENVISHGAWLMFEEAGDTAEDEALATATAFAIDFHSDVEKLNPEYDADDDCNIDIYVVQPVIHKSNVVYYLIYNEPGSLRVNGKR